MDQRLNRHNLLFSDEEIENLDLLSYIESNCGFVSDEEEKDLIKILDSLDVSDNGIELSIENILKF